MNWDLFNEMAKLFAFSFAVVAAVIAKTDMAKIKWLLWAIIFQGAYAINRIDVLGVTL